MRETNERNDTIHIEPAADAENLAGDICCLIASRKLTSPATSSARPTRPSVSTGMTDNLGRRMIGPAIQP